ncbi:hypothetical protein GGI1_24561, partial [Acidithiobacillus sp. GGI-221]
GIPPGTDGFHGIVQPFHEEGEPHLIHVPALLFAEQLASTADFQIVAGQGKADAQIFQGLDGVEAAPASLMARRSGVNR